MNKRVIPIRLSSVFILCIFSFFVFLPASAFSACPDTMTSYWKLDGELNEPYINEIDDGFEGECRAIGACPTATTNGAVGDGAQQFANTTSTGINIPPSATSTAPFDWAAGDSFTIEFWIKRNAGAISTNEVVVSRYYSPSTTNWWIGLQGSTGAASFRLRASDNSQLELNSTKTGLNDGQWHHIVAVRDAGLGKNFLYVDGSLDDGKEGSVSYTADFKNSVAPLNIGHLDGNFYYNGLIDEVAIYNVALPERIIQRHYVFMKPYCEVSAPGVFRKGAWYLDANGTGQWEPSVDTAISVGSFGYSTDIPITGDWNGDGYTSIGVFRNGAWYLDTNGSGTWNAGDKAILPGSFGLATDKPITGDWNGSGTTKIGVFRNGGWYLDTDGSGTWNAGDTAILPGSFGLATDIPITGDWNGDGFTNIGVFRNGAWYLDTDGSGTWNAGDKAILPGSFGLATDIPITGDWNGDGITNIGVFRNGAWYLDYNGNGKWDPGVDITIPVGSFGLSNDIPITGVWR